MQRINEYLSVSDIDDIFAKVLSYLSERGIIVQHAGVLKTLSAVGAQVDFQAERVCFPREIVKSLLDEAPRSFNLAGSDPSLDLVLPSPSSSFYTCTNTGARGIIDPVTNTHREVTTTDIKRWGCLVDGLENIHMCAVPTATDAPPETVDVHGLRALLTTTRKHIWVQPHNVETLPYLFDLAIARSGGAGPFKKRPCVSFIVDSFTPFQFKTMDMEVLLQACRLGVPIHACSLLTMGGTAPITPVGTVILAGIEVLGILLIAQAIQPGTPVLGLASSLVMDMQSGLALKASVDTMRTNAACAQYFHEAYGIPTHISGMTTDSVIFDQQSQAERCLGGLNLAQSGVDIMGRAGELEAAKIISPAQLAADDELAAMIKRLLAPLSVNTQTMVWDNILAVEPGGHFLEQPSTLNLFRETFRSSLFKYKATESRESGGIKDLGERARQKALEGWEELPDTKWLSTDAVAELDRIVREADRSLASSLKKSPAGVLDNEQ